MKKAGVAVVIGALLFVLLVIYSTLNMRKNRVEVCMEYQGRKACRTASGETPDRARRMAVDNACALIASGVTDSIGCQNTPPVSVRDIE